MRNKGNMMNIHDVELFDMTTKKEPGSKKITPILKTVISRPELVETSRVLTYKLTGEKYKVMKVVLGGFEKIKVGETKETNQTWKGDEMLDKIFIKMAKKLEKLS